MATYLLGCLWCALERVRGMHYSECCDWWRYVLGEFGEGGLLVDDLILSALFTEVNYGGPYISTPRTI